MKDISVMRAGTGAWKAFVPAREFASSVTELVQTLSCEGYPRVPVTARLLGMSARTLQRQLAAVGVTYESLVARARLATAVALLEQTDTKILDIALHLGYSDHAHFTRAFRRWTGRSPLAFRRERRANAPSARRSAKRGTEMPVAMQG